MPGSRLSTVCQEAGLRPPMWAGREASGALPGADGPWSTGAVTVASSAGSRPGVPPQPPAPSLERRSGPGSALWCPVSLLQALSCPVLPRRSPPRGPASCLQARPGLAPPTSPALRGSHSYFRAPCGPASPSASVHLPQTRPCAAMPLTHTHTLCSAEPPFQGPLGRGATCLL